MDSIRYLDAEFTTLSPALRQSKSFVQKDNSIEDGSPMSHVSPTPPKMDTLYPGRSNNLTLQIEVLNTVLFGHEISLDEQEVRS